MAKILEATKESMQIIADCIKSGGLVVDWRPQHVYWWIFIWVGSIRRELRDSRKKIDAVGSSQ